MSNLSLLFHRRGKAVSWLAFPFFLIFECFGPLLEVLGFIIILCSFYLGLIPNEFFFIFLLLAVSLGMMVSVASLSIEEVSSRTSNSATELFLLFLVAIVENLGYRQLNSVWRVMGMYNWLVKSDNSWGVMTRKANWNKEDSDQLILCEYDRY